MAYIDNLQASIAEHQRIIDAGLPEAAQAQQIINQHRAEIQRVQSSGGGTPAAPAAPTYTPPPAAFSALQLMENTLNAALGVTGLVS